MTTPNKLFNEENTAAIVKLVADGVTLKDACAQLNLTHSTVVRWVRKGNKGEGEYAAFAADYKGAQREAKEKKESEPMSGEELLRVVSAAARRGSVQAMKLRWEILQDERKRDGDEGEGDKPANPLAQIEDELAARRAR